MTATPQTGPTPVRLDLDQLEQLAELVAEKIARRQGELIDPAELARRLGRSRDYVYTHATELGAVRLGGGARPRLMFNWPLSIETKNQAPDGPAEHASRARVRPPKATAELLPIRVQA